MNRRDHDRERRFLADAARGHRIFIDHADQRLAAGDELYGDSWAWIGIRRHLCELSEEAADLGAWATLADQALDLDPGLTDPQREQLRAALALAAHRGAQAHAALTRALTSLAREETTAAAGNLPCTSSSNTPPAANRRPQLHPAGPTGWAGQADGRGGDTGQHPPTAGDPVIPRPQHAGIDKPQEG